MSEEAGGCRSRVREIILSLEAADNAGTDVDGHRWSAARGIWEELDSGKSQRELGKEIGKSGVYCHYYAKCWGIGRDYDGPLPPFNDIYLSPEVRGAGYGRAAGDQLQDLFAADAEVTGTPNDGGWDAHLKDKDVEEKLRSGYTQNGSVGNRFVADVRDAVDVVAGHGAIRALLTEVDIGELKRCRRVLGLVIAEAKERAEAKTA